MLKKMTFSRRQFHGFIGIVALSLLISMSLMAKGMKKPVVRFGLITDVHYADRETARERYYSQSLGKLNEFISRMNQEKVDFVVELVDVSWVWSMKILSS